MDREGDFFELFDAWREGGRDELIVRAKHDRIQESGLSLSEHVGRTDVNALLSVEIPRKSARRKKGKNKAQAPRSKRSATLEIRYCPVSIRPPRFGLSSKKSPVDVYIVHLKEQDNPTDGSNAIE